MRPWKSGLLIALMAAGTALLTINDPGLTIDEPINVGHGKRMSWVLSHNARSLFDPATIDWLWRSGHEHPPLARLSVGTAHALTDPQPDDPSIIVPELGRLASVIAYGLLIFTATLVAGSYVGRGGAAAAGIAVALTPRLFAHAHFASPEVVSSVAILWALAASGWALDQREDAPPLRRYSILFLAGLAIGIAMLTKLTGVVVPLAVTAMFVGTRGLRGLAPLVVIGAVALFTLIAGWPWLWPVSLPGYSSGFVGTFERLREFFLVGVERATIYVEYFGAQYPAPGKPVPWHFVWVFFAGTLPPLSLFLGLIGTVKLMRMPRASAKLWGWATPIALLVFTLPMARYDGERLILFVFPIWAVAAGVGVAVLSESLTGGLRYLALGLLIAGLIEPAYAIVRLHPYQLSYYSPLVGGLKGADKLGLEATYWGDSLSGEILDQLAERARPGDVVVLAPCLYDGHARYLTDAALAKKQIVIEPATEESLARADWCLLYNRGGYLGDPLPTRIMKEGELVHEVSRDGVWLSRLYRWTQNESSPQEAAPSEDRPN